MAKDTKDTQIYRILEVLHENRNGLTIETISKKTGYPLPSLRRAMSDMKKVGRIEKEIVYRLK